MVAISKLLNGGFLLVSQSVYQNVASPQQAAVENYNLIRFLGGSGPYLQRQGYGISTDVPEGATIEQVQLISRHGERYPSTNSGSKMEAINKKFMDYKGVFGGELAFLNDPEYSYFVPQKSLYEKETSPKNSVSPFAGTTDALKHGASFRKKYNSLYNSSEILPVFSSNSGRVYETARYFARGFLGDDFTESKVDWVILDESSSAGINSLTPRSACNAYVDDSGAKVKQLDTTYLSNVIKRLQKSNPGLNLTKDDVTQLFQWCAYEINVRGSSPMCGIYNNDELIQGSYAVDVGDYYSNGPGNNLTAVIGSTLLNASLTLLKDESNSNKIWLSFSHDTDLEMFHSALGIVEPKSDLPTDHVPFPNPYQHSSIVPQGARIYIEKFRISNTSYVRYIVNDAVIPISKCSSGPGFSCKLEDYEAYVTSRIGNLNFTEQCQPDNDYPSEVTFFWNYNDVQYNASLLNS